jgi:tetratricopeptide (TPR) repeat protein
MPHNAKENPCLQCALLARSNENPQEVVMNVRLVVSPVLALLLSSYASGQQMPQAGDEIASPVSAPAGAGSAFRQDLAHRIAMQEAAVRQAEAAHAGDVELGKIYTELGLLYEDAAQYLRSEVAVEHAVSLLRHVAEASGELATSVSQLGSLHIAMGKLRESEKEEQEALKLREKLGDPLQIARSWNDLAALYLAQHKFEKARDFARKAVAEFIANGRAGVFDRISSRYALSVALCYLKECPSAIPLLNDAIDEAKAKLQAHDFPIGFGDFLLGYAYWKSGNMSDAGLHMQEGTAAISEQLGWGHPAYLAVLKQYAQFLKENRQVEAANVVERRIRQAEAVVDVHSIQTGQGTFGFAGLR